MLNFTEEELKDIKYVVVTASLKVIKESETKGLFLGYMSLVKTHTQLVSKDERFLWIQMGDNVSILNTSHYDVDLIEIQLGNLVTERGPGTQEMALSRLESIQEAFARDNRVSISGLIDVDTYKLPAALQKEMDKSTEKETIKKPGPSRSGSTNYSGSRTSYPTYKKKEPSTTVIKRTTKYPTSAAILRMKAKVKEIKDGKYEPPELLPIPADKEDTEKKAVK